jgi:hypothetical protein
MRKERTLLVLGVLVSILPFLGFPDNWRVFLFVITGLSIIYLAYLFYKEAKARMPKDDNTSKTFVDNTDLPSKTINRI